MAMSDAHKAALAQGRRESRAIKGYLTAIAGRKPGRPPSPERLRQKIDDLGVRINGENDPLKTLELRQSRIGTLSVTSLPWLEASFVEFAASYSDRKGISYAAWREQGVAAAVLKQAGIGRGS